MSDEPASTRPSAGQEQGRRLDAALVERGLSPSRAQARAAIEAGRVRVDGVVVDKPSRWVDPVAVIEAGRAHPWASRGGLKLDHAFSVFGVDVSGRACLDIGASTGGFTDVLLARGAKRVLAVDVGRDQMLARLKADPRVVSREGLDARALTPELLVEALGEPPSMVVCDASFISLAKVAGPALDLAAHDAELVALMKPQFEVGRAHIGKGGVVTDAAAIDAAAREVETWLQRSGWTVVGWTDSPIAGGDGNRERLAHARLTRIRAAD
jgi:23S rRNA (cytidine1920-2'-O)/16S rRNA (cytidine1409-2'-O)-methyltransferase